MTTPVKTAAYTQCEQCGFWHAPDEPHCANCGVSLKETKYITLKDKSDKYAGFIGFGCIFIGAVIGAFTHKFFDPTSSVFLGIFMGGSVGAGCCVCIAFIIIKDDEIRSRLRLRVVAQGLRQNEELINKRLSEIRQKEQKIYAMVEELKQQGDPQRNRVRFQAIDKGAAELSRQRDRYTGKLREIELIRWSNQLSPLLGHSPQLNEQQTTERLNTLSEIQTKGQKLAQTWKQAPLADEETRCADRLNQALTTCDQLRQDLLDLKTALAVGDISAFNKEEQRASQTALELLDTFNAMPDVGGFTAGFKKLEDEYFRLQSEDEVRQLTK